VAAAGGTLEKEFSNLGIASTLGLSSEAAESLGASENVAQWDEDVKIVLDEPVGGAVVDPVTDQVEGDPATDADAVVDQPDSPTNPAGAFAYARQWDLRRIGAHNAWPAGRLGSPNVKVAILDTGLDYMHPDLVGRVDLSLSKSYVPEDTKLIREKFPRRTHEIADLDYHGTHVGATVASNAFVAAGVTSKVTLVGLKVLDRNGNGNVFNTLSAIEDASNTGVDVINMSLGVVNPLQRRDYAWFNEAINRATTYAHSKGVTVVVSAGNENLDLNHLKNGFKAYCTASTVTCVSATGPADEKASYSNYGQAYIDMAAPGGNGSSRVWAACSRFTQDPILQPTCQSGGAVLGLNGTSMAAPHASGLAALLVEDYERNPGKIRSTLAKYADDLGKPGNDPNYGQGRINVAEALGVNNP
jgi:subtilisin family serine protease